MWIRKQRGMNTSVIVIVCTFTAILLFLGPFYFESYSTDSKHVNRHRLIESNTVCSEKVSECAENHRISAVFKDGVLGNYETADPTGRDGRVEYGDPVMTPTWKKRVVERSVREYGYNVPASDRIALDRMLPDTRLKECHFWHYPENLPIVSVIIVFHNEALSTLLRTVHSVINTSPRHLVREVILIDDLSDKEHLKYRLELHLRRFGSLVRLYRNDEREGPIRSRTKGAVLAKADVIIFLDAHCECNKNWLPPLLTRIVRDRRVLVVPTIDHIDWNTFEYKASHPGVHKWGLFEWSLLYKENIVSIKEEGTRRYRSEPYMSPVHAGELFAMDKRYFFELGGYDPGLDNWGGENFELSLKIWLCGGRIEWVPCSRVGHVYKRGVAITSTFENQKIPSAVMNYIRVVEVWFDEEYKGHFYRRQPWLNGTPLKSLQHMVEFRRKNNCKSFNWYMGNIAYHVTEKYPAPLENLYWGQIRPWYTDQCWSFNGQDKLLLLSCVSRPYDVGQFFRLDVSGHLTTGEMCVVHNKDKNIPVLTKCPEEPKGTWEYNKKTLQLKDKELNLCVEFRDNNLILFLNICKATLHNQRGQIIIVTKADQEYPQPLIRNRCLFV